MVVSRGLTVLSIMGKGQTSLHRRGRGTSYGGGDRDDTVDGGDGYDNVDGDDEDGSEVNNFANKMSKLFAGARMIRALNF